ncbi:phage tail tape measure protein [Alistipes indistinctus]|uniref:phage tail tape measure protein n=1 Tax=Alistipes indistinctus TaxID=626932 RepID=UPI003A8396BE
MADILDYQVNYDINVNAGPGVEQVGKFAEAVKGLVGAKTSLDPAVKHIQEMIDGVEKIFKGKGSRPKEYTYTFKIDFGETETKLERIETLITSIKTLTTEAKATLVIDAGKKLDTNTIRSQARALMRGKELKETQTAEGKNAKNAIDSALTVQRTITRVIGKIVAGLKILETGHEINIKTDVAKSRLQEILTLMNDIKGASKMTLNIKTNTAGAKSSGTSSTVVADAGDKVLARQLRRDQVRDAVRRDDREHASTLKIREQTQRLQMADMLRRERESQKATAAAEARAERDRAQQAQALRRSQLQDAVQRVRTLRQGGDVGNTIYNNRRRAAINRLQYSRTPSLRSLPMMQFFNAYMAYGLLRSEVTKAMEYSNIMESAHSILRVADKDLSTFESRFDQMAANVRKVGVETKFTAVEIAGAVKYLSMAGMDIDTINKSIRPITNLALIGDNDVSQIADLATNIMSGYNIKGDSMNSVADILASTVSRSNVNVIEMAESYKMAAGYLKLAGVEFSESSAAIGILGNSGIKGTMAGTSLRAMATRFAKPTRESRKAMDRLGVTFTRMVDVYGKQVEQLKPLAQIFEELHKSGATMGDMQAIFGKIGGNAAMMLVNNYDKLRELTNQNKVSMGISGELAEVKQNTTKGLWAQVTSQFTESFMQAFEVLEPVIKSTLKSFLEKFKSPEFAKGIRSIGQGILGLLSTLASFGNWVIKHWSWLEPLIFTGVVATKLFKLAGALTNVGVAVGFIGKQRVASSTMELISGLTGFGQMSFRKPSFGDKRIMVKALREAGVEGPGVMAKALMGSRVGSASSIVGQGAATGLFASQVATGNGLIGAGASIGALGATAVAATAGVAALVGALGWVAYKTWQVKKAKDAVQEELKANKKYRYPTIEALHDSLQKTYKIALAAKKAVDEVTEGKTIEESSGQKIGMFTGRWWGAFGSMLAASHSYGFARDTYTMEDARQDDTVDAIEAIAERHTQSRINAGWAKLGTLKSVVEIDAFLDSLQDIYGQKPSKPEDTVSKEEDATKEEKIPLWRDVNGKAIYKRNIGDLDASMAVLTPDFARYINENVIPNLKTAAEGYRNAIADATGARAMIEGENFKFSELEDLGFIQDKDGIWGQKTLPKNATDKERSKQLSNFEKAHFLINTMMTSLRRSLGGSAEAAINVMKAAGIPESLYQNEPDSKDEEPYNANGILAGDDDGGAGGNYSGTGKLSSAAPKQVIVNIGNLLEVKTIDLLKSPEGQTAEIQNLKEQLAQALIDTVHDFDASWNG